MVKKNDAIPGALVVYSPLVRNGDHVSVDLSQQRFGIISEVFESTFKISGVEEHIKYSSNRVFVLKHENIKLYEEYMSKKALFDLAAENYSKLFKKITNLNSDLQETSRIVKFLKGSSNKSLINNNEFDLIINSLSNKINESLKSTMELNKFNRTLKETIKEVAEVDTWMGWINDK